MQLSSKQTTLSSKDPVPGSRLEILAAAGAMETASSEVNALKSQVAQLQAAIHAIKYMASMDIHHCVSLYQSQFAVIVSKAVFYLLLNAQDSSVTESASDLLRCATGVDTISVVGLIRYGRKATIRIGGHEMACVASLTSPTQALIQLSDIRPVGQGRKSLAKIAVAPPDGIGRMDTWIFLQPSGDAEIGRAHV